MISLAELFRPKPMPSREAIGLYECRRCKKQFVAHPFQPSLHQVSKVLGGDDYRPTASHVCNESKGATTSITEFGLGDLIGATVVVKQPQGQP